MTILYPKATAVWLVDNTSLTFQQIGDFCGLHHLEVNGIADGEVARDIRGADPIANGQLTREELDKAQADPAFRMNAEVSRHAELLKPQKKAPKYTPVSRRQDRPDAIAWFVKNHPEVTDAQISKLLGTTKSTIDTIRNRQHWNSANIKPTDPVTPRPHHADGAGRPGAAGGGEEGPRTTPSAAASSWTAPPWPPPATPPCWSPPRRKRRTERRVRRARSLPSSVRLGQAAERRRATRPG